MASTDDMKTLTIFCCHAVASIPVAIEEVDTRVVSILAVAIEEVDCS